MPKFKKEIERMCLLDVIEETKGPTDWVNSTVLVEKQNGDLRVCLDPRNLNEAIQRLHFQIPNLVSIKEQLLGAKIFSVLDMSNGFWNLELDKESQLLCTFNTPWGRYSFKRLAFGISAAPEIFQAKIYDLFGDLPGVVTYFDDFLVFGKNHAEHNDRLIKLLERAEEVGIKFNFNKCKFYVKEVRYLGHVFNEGGISADPQKIQVVKNIQNPRNIKELQRFLGVINYLGPFIENLSGYTTNLRHLLRKDVQFNWNESHTKEFNRLKEIISNTPVLAYYNPDLPLVLSVDASKDALGAVILQESKPIAYASCTMTDCQKTYSQIEKELLAIVYGVKKFHQYVYGRVTIVHTDHKPLITLFNKALHKIPPRLQRMMLKLQLYSLQVQYVPGKRMYIADTLSRSATTNDIDMKQLEEELNIQVNLLVNSLQISEAKLQEIKHHTESDLILKKLKEYITSGWPNNLKKVDMNVKPYYKIRHELYNNAGVIFNNNKVIIPTVMRKEVLNLIHEGHLGVERCKNMARNLVYWPNITVDIKNMVENCYACCKYASSNTREPLLSHTISTLPWEKIGVDIFTYNKKNFLLLVDYFSKYIEVAELPSYNSSNVITTLKSIFARHGIPAKVISDNGPPFNSVEFKKFCSDWNIEHITSSPYYPKSNGLAERSIQTIKKLFQKCDETGSDRYIALLQHRTTPKGVLSSPSQLLMSRNLRTKIPCTQVYLKPKLVNLSEHIQKVQQKGQEAKQYYDRTSRQLPILKMGDNVLMKLKPDLPWSPAKITGINKEHRSYVVKTPDGNEYRRNRVHLKKSPLEKVERRKGETVAPLNENNQNGTAKSQAEPSGKQSSFGRNIKKTKRFTFSNP